ncbi:hypothetical protein SEA_VIEENROSE_46 [Streptomyces phage VieEnRose]|nr:hypothetical protein SEA_VIEENROSE_46 [Streptomyces phage VieEnRose]
MSIEITEFPVEHASAEEALADWSFLTDDTKMSVVDKAARSIARKYEDTRTTEFDDAYQDALELMATHPVLQGDLEPGVLYTRLTQRLTHRYEADARRRSPSKTTSWELNNDKLAAQGY